jgi:hypothetical protein
MIQPFRKGTGPSCWPQSLGTILGGLWSPGPRWSLRTLTTTDREHVAQQLCGSIAFSAVQITKQAKDFHAVHFFGEYVQACTAFGWAHVMAQA